MDQQLLSKYICCPVTHGELKFVEASKNGTEKDALYKSAAGEEYPVINNIPRLLPNYIPVTVSEEPRDEKAIYRRVTKPYDEILIEKGYPYEKICKMDVLRYEIFKKTESFVNEHMKGDVLEVGAGADYLKKTFAGKYDNWVSLDYDIRSFSIDVQGDAQQLPFKDNSFDTIITIDVLEHIPNPEKAVKEYFRVLKPGGKIILSTPFMFWLHEEPFLFFHSSRFGLKHLFERNGFKVLNIVPIAGILATWGLLCSIGITKVFKFSGPVLRFFLFINKWTQLGLLRPLDKAIDKNKRMAQGHFIAAQK
jgi:SAM-dependent methyltransferase